MFVFQLPQKAFSRGDNSSPTQEHDVISTFFRECAWMFTLCTLGAAGYGGLLNAESGKRPKVQCMMNTIHQQRRRERGGSRQVVNRCRKLQQQLFFHAPSIWAILKQMQRVQCGCCSLIGMTWNCDASVIGIWLHNRRSSEIQSSRGWQHLGFWLKCNLN